MHCFMIDHPALIYTVTLSPRSRTVHLTRTISVVFLLPTTEHLAFAVQSGGFFVLASPASAMADDFTTEAFTLLAIGLCFILLRTYARLSKTGMAGFKLDDYLMLLAAVVYTAETVLAYTVGAYWHGLANNGMTDAERLALDPGSDEFRIRVNGSKTQVAGWSSYTLLLWLLKASMCSFYLRLTEGLEYRTKIFVGFALIASTWVTVLLSILLGCHPMHKNWQIYPDPGSMFSLSLVSLVSLYPPYK